MEINVNKNWVRGCTRHSWHVAAALNSADNIPATASSLAQYCPRAVGEGEALTLSPRWKQGRDQGGGKDDKLPEMPLRTFFCLSG